MKTLTIRWQRLVAEDQTCPRCGDTGEEVSRAVSALEASLAPLGIQVVSDPVELSLEEFKRQPLESNRIFLNGRPLEEWLGGQTGQSPCCDVCGPVECRTVEVGGQSYEAVPAELIVRAGLVAAAQMPPAPAGQPCCEGEKPQKAAKKSCCP